MGIITEVLRQQHRGSFDRPRHVGVPITGLDVSAYLIPTDGPESDGTLEWQHTLLVLVEVRAGDMTGLGHTYASYGSAYVVKELLTDIVVGHDALAVEESWWSMLHAVRNIGRPGARAEMVVEKQPSAWNQKGGTSWLFYRFMIERRSCFFAGRQSLLGSLWHWESILSLPHSALG